MFKKQTLDNVFATVPSRQLSFVIDPKIIPNLSLPSLKRAINLIIDLSNASPGVYIYLLLPVYLCPSNSSSLKKRLSELLVVLEKSEDIKTFIPNEKLPSEVCSELTNDSPLSLHANALLSLVEFVQADGIITDSEILNKTQYMLRQFHRIRIIHTNKFTDILEICAHGNMYFWATKKPERLTTIDTYYGFENEKCFGYLNWISDFSKTTCNNLLKDELHSALVNRYMFLLYARDMIIFFELQLDHFSRRGSIQRFGFPLGYHVTHFYLLLWAMLEQLTIIAKHACNLELGNRDCGIRKQAFWTKIKESKPNLEAFVKTERISEWIKNMADMRHAAAHKTIPLPTVVWQVTDESEMEEVRIKEELKKKYAALFSLLPKEYIRTIEAEMIQHWRIKHMKTYLTSAVLIKDSEEKRYFRDAVGSIDFDLKMLTEIIDAFLRELFGYRSSKGNQS